MAVIKRVRARPASEGRCCSTHARGGEREGGGPRSPTPTSLREGPPVVPPSRKGEGRGGARGSAGDPPPPFHPGRERERDGALTRWSRSRRGRRDTRTDDGPSTLPHQRRAAREGRLGERDGPRAPLPPRTEFEQRMGERDGTRASPPTDGTRVESDRCAGERDGPRAPLTGANDSERLCPGRHGLRPPSPLKARAGGGVQRTGRLQSGEQVDGQPATALPFSPNHGLSARSPLLQALRASASTSSSQDFEPAEQESVNNVHEEVAPQPAPDVEHVHAEAVPAAYDQENMNAHEEVAPHDVENVDVQEAEPVANVENPIEDNAFLFMPPVPCTNIMMLTSDVLNEIFRKLNPLETVRVGASCREVLRLLRENARARSISTFIGIVPMGTGKLILSTIKNHLLPPARFGTVNYLRDSFAQWLSVDVVDCRNGFLLLKLSNGFRIWNPILKRNDCIIPKSCTVQNSSDKYVAAALVRGDTPGHYGLVILVLGPPAFLGPCKERCLVLLVYKSATENWQRINTGLHLTDQDARLHPYSVSTDGQIFFLNAVVQKVLCVDYVEKKADFIDTPKCENGGVSRFMISRARGHLCLCRAALRKSKSGDFITVFRYASGEWQKMSVHKVPQDSYMLQLLGFAEENSLLMVRTGCYEIKMLDIQTGSWVPLQDVSVVKLKPCFAVEARTPFRYPFAPGVMEIDDYHFQSLAE